MADWIRFVQRVIGKLTGHRELFAFTPLTYGREGAEPSKLRQRQEELGNLFGTRLFSRAYPGVTGRVHLHDSMLQNDSPEEIAHYVSVGQSAMQNIEASLAAAGRSFADVSTCLDMACGAGRVLRLLQTKIDPLHITACDIDKVGVNFLAAEFGVVPLIAPKDFRKIVFPRFYDLIWVGSLFTHLEPADGFDLLSILAGRLNPRGVLVFSTQGAGCIEKLSFYGWMFPPQEARMRAELDSPGMTYAAYFPQRDPGYGITLYRRDALEAAMQKKFGEGLREVRFAERGWDNHQDVYAYQKHA